LKAPKSTNINNPNSEAPTGWKGSKRLSAARARDIYRRNLIGGAVANLGANFSVTKAYIGDAGFRSIGKRFIESRPESSPVFRTLAVQFPQYISQCDAPEVLQHCLVALATLDFIAQAESTAPIPMDRRFFSLYQRIVLEPHWSNSEALYRQVAFHPETVFAEDPHDGFVLNELNRDSFSLRFTDSIACVSLDEN